VKRSRCAFFIPDFVLDVALRLKVSRSDLCSYNSSARNHNSNMPLIHFLMLDGLSLIRYFLFQCLETLPYSRIWSLSLSLDCLTILSPLHQICYRNHVLYHIYQKECTLFITLVLSCTRFVPSLRRDPSSLISFGA
jgi:hypothetical protein